MSSEIYVVCDNQLPTHHPTNTHCHTPANKLSSKPPAQREGIAIAKREGVYKGRKKALSTEDVAIVLQRIRAGESKAQVARDMKVSRKTLYQYLNVMQVGL